MRPFETIWDHLALFGTIWDNLGQFGTIWDYLGPFGTIWDHLGPFGTIWDHLGPFGTILDHLGPFWAGYIVDIYSLLYMQLKLIIGVSSTVSTGARGADAAVMYDALLH